MILYKTLAERVAAFDDADVYPVISSEFTRNRPVADVFRSAAAGGAKVIQLREKHISKRALYDLAVKCRKIANDYGVLLIIDDHVDVALAAGADGVHLGQDDLPFGAAKRIAPNLLIGCSTHNREEALKAQSEGAGYINIGPIFPTATKEVGYPPLGVEAMARIVPQIHIPFSVMGGIKRAHFAELTAAGARHIAMVTEITTAPDVEATVRELRSLLK